MSTNLYPSGSRPFYTRMASGVLKFFRRSDHTEFYSIDGDNKRVLIPDTVRQVRRRCTIAEVNAGVTLLAALPGYKYRMVRAKAIAIGGNAACSGCRRANSSGVIRRAPAVFGPFIHLEGSSVIVPPIA